MDESETLFERVVNERDPQAFEELLCKPNDELDRIIDAWKGKI